MINLAIRFLALSPCDGLEAFLFELLPRLAHRGAGDLLHYTTVVADGDAVVHAFDATFLDIELFDRCPGRHGVYAVAATAFSATSSVILNVTGKEARNFAMRVFSPFVSSL